MIKTTNLQKLYTTEEVETTALNNVNISIEEVLEGPKPGEQVITSSYDNFGDVEKLVLK